MTDALPDPLVPQEVDLSDFDYTPVFRGRLFNSTFHARANDAEWRAGFTLWLKSWDQHPSGTLPDDDIDLCRLAELARDLKTWAKLKPMALHGWVKCDDGRLHHPVVAEVVLGAWEKRSSASKKGKAGARARWGTGTNKNGTGNGTGTNQLMPNDGKRSGSGSGSEVEGTSRSTPLASSAFALSASGPPNGKGNGHDNGADDSPVAITIPLVGNVEFPVTEAMVKQFDELYPAVDVLQTLREIRGWNLSHPQKRKTARGVLGHINTWLAKEQNGGH